MRVNITKVVSENVLFDMVGSIENFLGANLSKYERMVTKGTNQIEDEVKEKGYEFDWWRYEITQLTNGALVIMLYGETK